MLYSNQFYYNPSIYTMDAEASDLQAAFNGEDLIEITSSHTGQVMYFKLVDVSRDSDGDITIWHYRPHAMNDQPCNVRHLIIYND